MTINIIDFSPKTFSDWMQYLWNTRDLRSCLNRSTQISPRSTCKVENHRKPGKRLGARAFYVNKDGSYNLGDKSIETLNSPRLMSQEV